MRKETDDVLQQSDVCRPLTQSDLDVRRLPGEGHIDAPVRSRYFRPTKQSVTIRLDTDIVAWFKARAVDGGYQTAINRALRDHMEQQRKPS